MTNDDQQQARRLRDELNEFAAALDERETGPLPPCPANPTTAWGLWLVGVNRKANYGHVLTPAEATALPMAAQFAHDLGELIDAQHRLEDTLEALP